jgi:uncharacterized membrane protein
MTAWVGIAVLLYVYSNFENQLVTQPFLWIVVFIATGIASYISMRLAQWSLEQKGK